MEKKSKKPRPHFNRQEKAILKVLYEERRWLSMKEVAEKAHMSWITAKKYIDKLIERGWLEEENKEVRLKNVKKS